jgi:acyl-coenzyme A thioesterase PaaI-like protein
MLGGTRPLFGGPLAGRGIGEKIGMNIPEGYAVADIPSAFVNHIGRIFQKRVKRPDGVEEVWAALRVEDHHVNSWGFCHGALMSSMAEIGTAGPCWDLTGPAVVAIELSMQFIKAPKLGELIEVCGTLTKKTRSLAFSQARAEVNGDLVFLATSVQKILGK